MALVNIDTWFPPVLFHAATPVMSSLVIDAATEKVAHMGYVTWPDDGSTSKDISRIQFRTGAVTKGATTTVTVSLQDPSLATNPLQPDGTQDQTVTVTNAQLVANTWIRTDALSANRTVALGARVCVVFEFGTFAAGNIVNIQGISDHNSTNARNNMAGVGLFTGTWAIQAQHPSVLLEFSDGSFGRIETGWVATAITSVAANTGSTPDEIALEFQVPFDCVVDGAALLLTAAGVNLDIVLYDSSSTALATVTIDANALGVNGPRWHPVYFPAVSITKNTTYRLAALPTTASSISVYYFDVNTASHMGALPGGTAWTYTTRTNAGAWAAATTTRRPFACLHLRQIHNDG